MEQEFNVNDEVYTIYQNSIYKGTIKAAYFRDNNVVCRIECSDNNIFEVRPEGVDPREVFKTKVEAKSYLLASLELERQRIESIIELVKQSK